VIISPEKFFGFQMGPDRKLANWDKLLEYYRLKRPAPPGHGLLTGVASGLLLPHTMKIMRFLAVAACLLLPAAAAARRYAGRLPLREPR
jgi:hypothetical protein